LVPTKQNGLSQNETLSGGGLARNAITRFLLLSSEGFDVSALLAVIYHIWG